MKQIATTVLVLVGAFLCPTNGFLQPTTSHVKNYARRHSPVFVPKQVAFTTTTTTTGTHPSTLHSRQLCMSFKKLPPSNNENNDGLGEVLGGAFALLTVIAFFASPLGAIFFALFNGLLALAFILPVGAIVAFQAWQFFNTTQGACPSCGAPIRVLKDGSPSLCLNCGSVVQQSRDGIIAQVSENANNVFLEDEKDSLFGGFLDTNAWGSSRQSSPADRKEQVEKIKRERTIIDVVVEEDDRK